MEAGLLCMEADGSRWKLFVAFMEAGAARMGAGLLRSSMEFSGSLHGSRCKYRYLIMVVGGIFHGF